MKLYLYLVAIYFAGQLSWAKGSKMVCYYDTYGPEREGKFYIIKFMKIL